jgi:hypothetical protein
MLTPEERAKIAADAEAVGLRLGGYLRMLGMRMQTPRTKTAKATPDALELSKLGSQVAKIGGNLNQLAKLGNQGQLVPPSSLAACISEIRELALKIATTLDYDY